MFDMPCFFLRAQNMEKDVDLTLKRSGIRNIATY
jgi:hypothetical protein